MPTPRSMQVNLQDPGWVHVCSRTVRRAFLAGEGCEHRKQWMEDRLRFLSGVFCCEVAAFAVMSNHIHAVVRLDPGAAAGLTDREVAERWLRAFPGHRDAEAYAVAEEVAVDEAQVRRHCADAVWSSVRRERLGSLPWFMRCLCENLARRANQEDGCSGRFWEGRYSATPLLDQAALIACMAYVDLNPIRAGMTDRIEDSAHTSGGLRLAAQAAAGIGSRPKATGPGSKVRHGGPTDAVGCVGAPTVETAVGPGGAGDRADGSLWLASIRRITAYDRTQAWTGWTAMDYLRLVEATGRVIRGDKTGAIPAELPDLLARLDSGIGLDRWVFAMRSWRAMSGGTVGTVASRQREASRRERRWVRCRCTLFRGRIAC